MEDSETVAYGDIEGISYVARVTRPYSFWVINPTEGPKPLECDGHFTSLEEAKIAFNKYATRIRENKKSVHYDPVEPPVLKVKVSGGGGKSRGYVEVEAVEAKEE